MNIKPVTRRKLYPHSEPRRAGRLKVSDLHELYWEDSGPGHGIPVLGLHGGPGGGASPEMRRFFDPRRFRTQAGRGVQREQEGQKTSSGR